MGRSVASNPKIVGKVVNPSENYYSPENRRGNALAKESPPQAGMRNAPQAHAIQHERSDLVKPSESTAKPAGFALMGPVEHKASNASQPRPRETRGNGSPSSAAAVLSAGKSPALPGYPRWVEA